MSGVGEAAAPVSMRAAALSPDALDRLLDQLQSERFGIGVRARIDAHRLREALQDASEIDLQAAVASLIVKDRESRARFDTLYRLHAGTAREAMPSPAPPPPTPLATGATWRRRLVAVLTSPGVLLGVAMAVVLAALAVWIGPALLRSRTVEQPVASGAGRPLIKRSSEATREAPPSQQSERPTPSQLLMALLEVSGTMAPTPRELHAAGLFKRLGYDGTLTRLVRDTGLDPDWPIPLENEGYFLLALKRLHAVLAPGEPFGAGKEEFAANIWDTSRTQLIDSEVLEWAKTTLAKARESQGQTLPEILAMLPAAERHSELKQLLVDAAGRDPENEAINDSAVEPLTADQLDRLLVVALQLKRNPRLDEKEIETETPEGRAALIAARRDSALALMPIAGAFPGAAWQPKPPAGVLVAPFWLAYAVAALPLVLTGWRLARRNRNRRAYLNSRLPRLPPVLSELHLEAPRRLTADFAGLHRTAHSLQVRIAEETPLLDTEATALATARAGGLFTPVRLQSRQPPDYLVLIEASGLDDLDAARLAGLAHRLADAGVALDVLYFLGDTRHVYSDLAARPVPIERLAATHAGSRLILMGAADRFLDPLTFAPEPWTDALKAWERRAWLTPKPLDEWGRHEFEIATELDMPVGRATSDGLSALAELLGLDGRDERPLFRVSETAGAHVRALPEVLRIETARYLSAAPLDDSRWRELSEDLGSFLGAGGYRWLSVLAIWPQLQWDMALFLGVGLDDDLGEPLYSEGRVAALTQLPWMRAGSMPRWLRRRLVAELADDARAKAVALIWKLIDGRIDERKGPDTVTWRLGTDAKAQRYSPAVPNEGTPDLLRETLFLETLAGERIPDHDLDLEAPEKARKGALARFLQGAKIGWPDVGTVASGLALAAGLFWLTPGSTLPTGAFLPLIAALLTLALASLFAGRFGLAAAHAGGVGAKRVSARERLAGFRQRLSERRARRGGIGAPAAAPAPAAVDSSRRAEASADKVAAPISSEGLGADEASSLASQALVHETKGEYDLAEPLYQRSLSIREKALGPDHPDVGTSLNNLAGLYRAQGKYDLAEPLYQRTLSIFEKALGPDHPSVGRVLSNLAELHRGQGDYDLAESLYKRTKSIFETALGPESVQARSVRSALAELNRAQGNFDIAEAEPRLPSASKESPRKRYVYLSWTRADKQAALFVRDELVRAGIEVWINIDILPGASWADEAQRAIEESICIVALWSAAAAHSPWVRKEIGFGEGAGKLFVLATDEEPAEIPGLLMRRLRPSDSGAGEPDYETAENRAELRRLAAEIRRLVEADRKGPVPS